MATTPSGLRSRVDEGGSCRRAIAAAPHADGATSRGFGWGGGRREALDSDMAKGEKEVPELVRAAEALEDELVRLEALSKSVRKMHLDSQKNIARAARELNEALVLPDRLADGLRALATAMERMQARQQAALEPLASTARDIQQRMQRIGEYLNAFAALGKAAGEATALIQSEHGDTSAVLDDVKTRLTRITDDARSLCETARADGFPEVARDADALGQSVAALRMRLGQKDLS